MQRQVILIAGPSGAGKSRSPRLGLPVLQLDDYYKDGDDPTLPRFASGTVDWDDPDCVERRSRRCAGLRELSAAGTTDVPVYDISANACVDQRILDLGGSDVLHRRRNLRCRARQGVSRTSGLPTARSAYVAHAGSPSCSD